MLRSPEYTGAGALLLSFARERVDEISTLACKLLISAWSRPTVPLSSRKSDKFTRTSLSELYKSPRKLRCPRPEALQFLRHVGNAESVPHMQEELERLRARTTELTRGLSSEREGRVNLSDFLELRGTVGRLQAEMSNLQARVDISSTLSRANESSRAPVPVYSGDRGTLSNYLKLFQTWTSSYAAGDVLVTEVPVRVVGNERPELENIHGREKVNQSIAVWTGLVKGIEKDKTLLDMVITAGSPSEAWKILLSLVGESSEAAQDRVKKEFEELSFEVGRESMRDYIASRKAVELDWLSPTVGHGCERYAVISVAPEAFFRRFFSLSFNLKKIDLDICRRLHGLEDHGFAFAPARSWDRSARCFVRRFIL